MSNGQDMVIYLMAWFIKKDLIEWNSLVYKWVNTFLNHMNYLVKILMSNLIYLIMQQKQLSKIFHMLILHSLH